MKFAHINHQSVKKKKYVALRLSKILVHYSHNNCSLSIKYNRVCSWHAGKYSVKYQLDTFE